MGLITTLLIMAGALGLGGFARYKANQPYEPGTPRLINWNLVMILAGVVAIIMLVHLFSLSGFEVGQGRGRRP